VIQEALGTLNNTHLARAGIDYAYNHGVAVIASAADEAAQHHNYVSSLPHTIVVNSVNKYPDQNGVPEETPKSYLTFNGCTNFSSKVTVAIPSSSCSSNATGVGAGIAGLIYSAALDARDQHKLGPRPGCTRTDGTPCPISANEVRQLMASGTFGTALNPDGTFDTTNVDDVNFLKNAATGAPQSEPNCATKAAGCTDPNQALQQQVNINRPIVSPPNSQSYPARFGFDQFYGWGRVNAFKATNQVAQGHVPPEVEITSPDWFAQVDPTKPTAEIKAQVWNRGGTYSCKVYVAPGSYPNNHLTSGDPLVGDFKQVPSPVCNGGARTAPIDGVVAALDLNDLKSRFPADPGNFRGRESGQGQGQTSNGRPNSEPYGFTVRIVASTPAPGVGQVGASGEDRRQFQLHRDQDMLDGFPKLLPSDGESSPALADLNGDNRNELIYATADGIVHAIRPDGSELPGWPVHGDSLPLHSGGRAFKSGEVPTTTSYGSMLASVAVGDLDRDGSPEVVAADMEGRVYAWNAHGQLLWKREANPAYSGKPLQPFVNVRHGKQNRTQHGFVGSPVLADLDGNGTLEVVAANMDRHVYAWNAAGAPVPHFPVLVVDLDKVKSIDPTTHAITFDPNKVGDALMQGAIIDTPAVGDLNGDHKPEIVVGTNEEYTTHSLDPRVDSGDEGDTNVGTNSVSALFLSYTGQLANANGRLFAIKATGDADGKPNTADWVLPGWPVKLAILEPELLPVVGEGVAGSPILGPVNCPFGGSGEKAAAFANTGVAYVLNPDGSSCLGNQAGHYNSMHTDTGGNTGDHPAFPAVGHPAFADFGGNNGPASLLAPVAGLNRALDVVFPEYQKGSQDLIASWDPTSGLYHQGFPARMNDLQFITGPSAANVDTTPGEELLAGSAYNDVQAYTGAGQPPNDHWPKLTSDWVVANPLIGTFGSLDTDPGARRVVIDSTRSGELLAWRTPAAPCEANADHPLGSWPKFHHDLANSGDYKRDAVDPGVPFDIGTSGGNLTFKAPGDDLLCGKAAAYQVAEADFPLSGGTFFQGDQIPTTLKPAAPGTTQTLELGGKLERYVSIRAVDDQGNVGPTVTVATAKKGLGGGAGGGVCGDRKAPGTTIERHPLKPTNKGLTVVGHADDGGCTKLSEAQRLNSILVSLSIAQQVAHHKCRWLQPDNTFSKPRSCNRPTNLRAKGKYSLSKRKLIWSYKTSAHFPPGTYIVQAHAVDQSGNVERRVSRLNHKVMKVPKPRRRRH
jgi:hypothetical protein